jgi:DnaK suppressor protein
MQTYDPSLAAQFTELLARREEELRARLSQTAQPAAESAEHEVQDFKDMAGEQIRASLQEMQARQAERELGHVLAARRRMAEDNFGECLDCGQPIDLRRLMALPATPLCASCQGRREHGHPSARRSAAA